MGGFHKNDRLLIPALIAALILTVAAAVPSQAGADAGMTGGGRETAVDIPVVGSADMSRLSLPAVTVILGALDSFNPCAYFVLLFLLSLLVHAGSRKRMFLIGGTFVLFSGLVYFLSMAAWLNVFLVVGGLSVITSIAGAIAVAAALINIKDFFLFGKGLTLSIPGWAKPRLFARMRELLKSTSVYSMMAGTAVLALAANAYELLCTAGFPMVFTRVLTLHGLSLPRYYLYLLLYNVVYVLPLSAIVVVFSATLGARKLTEWQGRKLKLVSGTMMLGLGTVLLLKPALLTNALVAVILLAAALASAGIIIFLTRRRVIA